MTWASGSYLAHYSCTACSTLHHHLGHRGQCCSQLIHGHKFDLWPWNSSTVTDPGFTALEKHKYCDVWINLFFHRRCWRSNFCTRGFSKDDWKWRDAFVDVQEKKPNNFSTSCRQPDGVCLQSNPILCVWCLSVSSSPSISPCVCVCLSVSLCVCLHWCWHLSLPRGSSSSLNKCLCFHRNVQGLNHWIWE